ncbi:hypothetical protein PRZ48_013318 [Zasmidium cellare]|uniref:Xylanolytic transcriptional activator regulatory domain-containing protein n=1 Tax=Zasmidium cellare TaxID=395010 RepID=A0ABR0E405_ZASCE|nr:hypothetical protein PRZ48_013318 [Zasmidium cellare]
MLQSAPTGGTFARENTELARDVPYPSPSEDKCNRLLDAAYQYTQARYCIVDWSQIKRWHSRRDELCSVEQTGALHDRTAAYFLWMIYGIGAGFVPEGVQKANEFFSQAMRHLNAALSWRDSTTLQALLVLAQYQVRATGGPSVWHVVGFAIRLCTELGYHQPASEAAIQQDPLGRTRWSRDGAMSSGEVDEFLHQLDEWKARAPTNFPSNTPRQEFAIIEENYLRAVTDVTRPKLDRKGNAIVAVERDMLLKCATCAAEACEPSLMAMYEAFYHGVTVLQCLTLDFSILPTQSIRRAAMACSSTLSVYTRICSATAPFLQLFEALVDDVLNHANSYSLTPTSAEDEARLSRAKSAMQEATVSDPSHVRR